MNCEEVQKQLSDLLDKSLDIERAQEIQEHLVTCSACSAEMASLVDYQQLMSNLPVIEPPVGFTARVMAEVRETAHPPTLWERLFLPLRTKIPLQATAVVLIAALAAYIYQKEPLQREPAVSFTQPESSFDKQVETDNLPPSGTPTPTAPSKTKQAAEETKARVQEFKDSAQLKKPQSPPKPEEPHEPIAGNQFAAPRAARAQDQVRSPATLSPTPLEEKSSAANEAASPRLEQSSAPVEHTKGALAPVPQPEKENIAKDAAAARKPLLLPEGRGRSTTSSLNALGSGTVVGTALPADHELAIRLKEPGRDHKAAADRLSSGNGETEPRSLPSQEEAKNLDQARQQAIQTGQQQTVWVTIARNQYELFKKQLEDLGNIEAESSTPDRKNDAVDKSSDQLRIKVTILPLSSGNPVSSQPSGR
jgi:Putative zinc-finger/Predicted integral membrane protein (DUF2275)